MNNLEKTLISHDFTNLFDNPGDVSV